MNNFPRTACRYKGAASWPTHIQGEKAKSSEVTKKEWPVWSERQLDNQEEERFHRSQGGEFQEGTGSQCQSHTDAKDWNTSWQSKKNESVKQQCDYCTEAGHHDFTRQPLSCNTYMTLEASRAFSTAKGEVILCPVFFTIYFSEPYSKDR